MSHIQYDKGSILYVFVQNALGDIRKIVPASGGLVHSVFKVTNMENREYYLKVRGNHFTGIPTIESVPHDIIYEGQALRACSRLAPTVFPHVIAEDDDTGMLLMTSVMQTDDVLLHLLTINKVTRKHMQMIGKTLSFVHNKLSQVTIEIRNDGQYYDNNLLYRLGMQNNEILDSVIDELSQQKRSLILGDLSPKNLGIHNDALRICDLDTAHYGNNIFDIGFFIGHIYLHGIVQKYQSDQYVQAFLKGYQWKDTPQESLLLKRIALGTLLYRLDNEVIPYQLQITNSDRQKAISRVRELLMQTNLNWDALAITI